MRAVILAVLVFALALPAGALAQDQGGGNDPFGPVPAAPTPAPTPVPQSTPTSGNGGDVNRSTLLVIGGGLLLVFLVIGRVIMRDAKQHLPADARGEPLLREQGPHRHAKHAKARARAKTKAQRAARRRNR
jgi:hypothetical protein